MRAPLVALVLAGCGATPPPSQPVLEAPPPRARLLDEELRAPEGGAGETLQLEMPELGSELPSVIVVGEPDDEAAAEPAP